MKTTNCLGYRVVCLHSEVDSTITYLFVGFNYNIKNSIIITTHECWRRNYLCFSFFFIALIILGAQIWGVQTRCRIADFGLNPTGTTTWWRDLKMCCRGVIFQCHGTVLLQRCYNAYSINRWILRRFYDRKFWIISRYQQVRELWNYYVGLKAYSVLIKNLLFRVIKISVYKLRKN